MKTYILKLLLVAFAFVTVHDCLIVIQDGDTQAELILQANGQLERQQMCDVSQIHKALHQMIVCSSIVENENIVLFPIRMVQISLNLFFYGQFDTGGLYRPPII